MSNVACPDLNHLLAVGQLEPVPKVARKVLGGDRDPVPRTSLRWSLVGRRGVPLPTLRGLRRQFMTTEAAFRAWLLATSGAIANTAPAAVGAAAADDGATDAVSHLRIARRRVFSLDAMAACSSMGHRWRRVYSWHDVGCSECERCGETGPVTSDSQVAAMARETVAQVGEQCGAPSPLRDGTCASVKPCALHDAPPVQWQEMPAAPTPQRRPRAPRRPDPKRARSSAVERPVVNRVVDGSIPSERATSSARVRGTTVAARRAEALARRAAREQRNAEIVRRALSGESVDAVAHDVGMHRTHVYLLVRRAIGKAAIPKNVATDARNQEIARRRAAGESPAVLGPEFGLHPSRIPQIVREVERARAAGTP